MLIELTNDTNKKILVNIEKCNFIFQINNGSKISFPDDFITVKETIEQIKEIYNTANSIIPPK